MTAAHLPIPRAKRRSPRRAGRVVGWVLLVLVVVFFAGAALSTLTPS